MNISSIPLYYLRPTSRRLVECSDFKYNDELSIKTKVSVKTLAEILHDIITESGLKIIPKDETERFLQEAETLSPDIDDIQYFALALKLKCPIWSNDKVLKSQQKVAVCSTEDLIKLLSTN